VDEQERGFSHSEAAADVFLWCLAQLKALLKVLETPFEEQPGAERFKVTPPKEIRIGVELLSCSS